MDSVRRDQVSRSRCLGQAGGGSSRAKKVKSGCQTCRLRKVKCDEGRPACVRCVSTKRVCKGYGVWGGGTNLVPITADPTTQVLLSAVAPESQAEHGCMQWFCSRTAVKFRGAFGSSFWDALVMRGSLEEPAIFHAMLALSSVHKRVWFGVQEMGVKRYPDLLEQFSLRQYNKAVTHLLEPRFTGKDKASVRVTLVACMLFVCLELLRGRYNMGNVHLQSGIKLLAGLDQVSSREPIDDWLVEVFTRMTLLAVQFGQGYWFPSSPHLLKYQPLSITFESPAQARDNLDYLFNDIFYLAGQCRRKRSGYSGPGENQLEVQRRIKLNLQAWLHTYKASRVTFQVQLDKVSSAGYQLLLLYYTMANILVHTCLSPEDEMAFDAHGPSFVSIITSANRFLETVRAVLNRNPALGSGLEMFHFTADIGWIPPLYFTALHCRIHSVRTQAIKLLRSLPSREGIWDAIFAASVAVEIMRIEEADYRKDNLVGETLLEPHDHDFSLLTIPASRRVYDVQVILPDSPSGKAILIFKRKTSGGGCEVITRERNVLQQNGIEREEWSESEI